MAHVKGSGSVTQHKQGSRHGKRRGVKKFSGEKVITGNIIVRQKGAVYKTAKGAGMGKDHTIFALIDGIVKFGKKFGKTTVSVVEG